MLAAWLIDTALVFAALGAAMLWGAWRDADACPRQPQQPPSPQQPGSPAGPGATSGHRASGKTAAGRAWTDAAVSAGHRVAIVNADGVTWIGAEG